MEKEKSNSKGRQEETEGTHWDKGVREMKKEESTRECYVLQGELIKKGFTCHDEY